MKINFKEWLKNEGGMIAKGKATVSLLKPGPRDQIKICGASGGPAPCNVGQMKWLL